MFMPSICIDLKQKKFFLGTKKSLALRGLSLTYDLLRNGT